MTLQNLRYIIEITNCRSFSEAAKALYISQSTLSSAVKETEESLGITIFTRTNRGTILTRDGEDFLRYAKEIVAQTDYLQNRYQNRSHTLTRFSVSAQHLPFAVRAFKTLLNSLTHPAYDVAMRECPTHQVFRDVSTGRSDMGVVMFYDMYFRKIQKALRSQKLSFFELGKLNIYVFMRKTHPLAHLNQVPLEELKDYAFVTYDQEDAPNQYMEEIPFYEYLDKNIHVCDRCTKIALIRGSDSFSIGPDLPNSNADQFHKGLAEIVAIPLKEPIEPLHVGYLCKQNIPLQPVGETYLTFLKENIQLLGQT